MSYPTFRLTSLAILLFLGMSTVQLGTAQSLTAPEVRAWKEDINHILSELWGIYPQASERLDQDALQNAADKLKSDLPDLSHDEVVIRLQALLALTGEGSNTIYPFQEKLNYHMLPLKAYWFADGLFICAGTNAYESLIGKQILAVNEVPIEVLWERIKPLLPGDNEYQKRGAATYVWQMAPWLAYLTKVETGAEAVLTLGNGEVVKVAFRPNAEFLALDRQLPSYRSLGATGSKREKGNYWMEYLPKQQALFIQFLAIRDNEDKPGFKNFVQEIEQQLERGKVDKVIIDNRYGGGGNGFKLKPLTDLLRENEALNQRGKLFVLIGRGTRGTVQELSSILELNTKAVLVGEPTGEGPNSVGDIKGVILPNSGIEVWLVHTFWPTSWPQDPRMSISPEIEVNYQWAAYAAGEDPWLEAALGYSQEEGSEAMVDWRPEPGKYRNGKYTVTIEEEKGKWQLSLKRKLKSFFELHTELYPTAENRYGTDIPEVFIERSTEGDRSLILNWKGLEIPLVR